jgi:hypothetical protein
VTEAAARAVMAIAGNCLGDRRRDWALAMQAELDAAIDDGRPLSFALGCLAGAVREMPMHAEGRFLLVNHAIAIGMVVPIAALLVSGTLLGWPILSAGNVGIFDWVTSAGGWTSLVNVSKQGAVPALALLAMILVAGHLLVPWYMLERDWDRVAMLARMNAAATATLLVLAGVLFLGEGCTLLPVAALAVEWLPISLLSRWHARISSDAPAAHFAL